MVLVTDLLSGAARERSATGFAVADVRILDAPNLPTLPGTPKSIPGNPRSGPKGPYARHVLE
jgi:hypothetical protein